MTPRRLEVTFFRSNKWVFRQESADNFWVGYGMTNIAKLEWMYCSNLLWIKRLTSKQLLMLYVYIWFVVVVIYDLWGYQLRSVVKTASILIFMYAEYTVVMILTDRIYWRGPFLRSNQVVFIHIFWLYVLEKLSDQKVDIATIRPALCII